MHVAALCSLDSVHTVNVCARGIVDMRLVDAPNLIDFMHANAHI